MASAIGVERVAFPGSLGMGWRVPLRVQTRRSSARDCRTSSDENLITRRVCDGAGLAYDAAVVDHFPDIIATDLRQPLCACYPRDIVHQIV
jgi:hypothetical protein